MVNAFLAIRHETSNFLFIICDILKDIPRPWDPPMLPPEYFASSIGR